MGGGAGRQRESEFEIAGAMWGNFVWRHEQSRNNAEMPNPPNVAWRTLRRVVEVVHLAPGSVLCLLLSSSMQRLVARTA